MNVMELAVEIGVEVELIPQANIGRTPVWDGHRILHCTCESDLLLFHEITHWVMARPSERELLDFGLGCNVTFYDMFENGLLATGGADIDSDDDGEFWVGSPRIAMKTAWKRETDAVFSFLLAPVIIDATTSDSFDIWAEFGGCDTFVHLDHEVSPSNREEWERQAEMSLVRVGLEFCKHGIEVEPSAVDAAMEMIRDTW